MSPADERFRPLDRCTATLATDPFLELGDGALLQVTPQVFGGSDAGEIPAVVDNWTFFGGALSALAVVSSSGSKVHGTAVMLAPGLAATATHVIQDDLDALGDGDAQALLLAPTGGGMDLWKVSGVTATASEITYLSVTLASDIDADWSIRVVPCTTRSPAIGESVHIVGFRVEDDDVLRTSADLTIRGDLYTATGTVQEVFPEGRDNLLVNYPAFQVDCGSLGGMSGGAVIDSTGHLLGLISRGFTSEDGRGPTYASWIVGALPYPVTIMWPAGLGKPTCAVFDLPADYFPLQGREHVTLLGDLKFSYRPWP